MSRRAARARRWMLWAAPMMALFGLRWRAGGAALGLALWLGLGLLLPSSSVYPYPRKRGPAYHRLFLGFSACVFLLGIIDAAALRFFPDYLQNNFLHALLFWMGGIGFALPLGQKAGRLSISRKPAWTLAALFFALFLISILPR